MRDVAFEVLLPRHPESESLLSDIQRSDVNWHFSRQDTAASLLRELPGVLKTGAALIHSHGFTAGVLVALCSLFSRHKHLMTAHEVLNDAEFVGLRGSMKRTGVKRALERIDSIHCLTEEARENLYGFAPRQQQESRKVRVIRHGIDTIRFQAVRPRALRAELGVSEDTVLFGFLGRFMEAKGFDVLIDAVDMLISGTCESFRFVVLAVGYGGLIRESRSRIEARGLSQYFRFMEFVPDVGPILKGLDVMVMPSRWEASGLLAMEAMVCGTPVIGSSCIGLRETLAGTPSITVEAGSAVSLARAMREVFTHDPKPSARAFTSEAQQLFDGQRSFRALRALYAELISE
jgi:glycosyltransferase involved in cell wall biosynthesis